MTPVLLKASDNFPIIVFGQGGGGGGGGVPGHDCSFEKQGNLMTLLLLLFFHNLGQFHKCIFKAPDDISIVSFFWVS